MLHQAAFLLLALQLGNGVVPVASQREINAVASSGNYIHAEEDIDNLPGGTYDRAKIKVSSSVPVTIQRYSDDRYLEGDQPGKKILVFFLLCN